MLAAGCESRADLFVELRTDLEPEVEVSAARTEVRSRATGALAGSAERPLRIGDPLGSGVRIAELDALALGSYDVFVALDDPADVQVLRRDYIVELRGQLTLTALLARSCLGVSCAADET